MRIAVTLVIDMSDQQVRDYAAEFGLVPPTGKPRARDTVEHVRDWLLADVTRGPLGDYADISIKR